MISYKLCSDQSHMIITEVLIYFSHWHTPTFGINKLHQQQKEIIWQFHWKKTNQPCSFLKSNHFKRATFCLEAHKNLGKFSMKKAFFFLNPKIQHVLRILHSSVISFSLLLYSVANLLWNESHLSQSTHTVVSRIPSVHSCTRKKNFFVPKVTLKKKRGGEEGEGGDQKWPKVG